MEIINKKVYVSNNNMSHKKFNLSVTERCKAIIESNKFSNTSKLKKVQLLISKNVIILFFIGCVIGFINGFWGGGGGMITVPILTSLIGLSEKPAHATTILIMLPISVASLIMYACKGFIQWANAGIVTGGFVAGGIIGAIILKKINNKLLKFVFSIIIIASGIRMLF